MTPAKCPKCGTPTTPGQLACTNCSALLFDPQVSTVHMRLDPRLLRLRRSQEQTSDAPLTEHTISLQIRGMFEKLAFEEGTELVLGRVDPVHPSTTRFDLTMYGALEKGVSREHAVLRYKDGKLTITDLNSANGTTVNLKKLNPNESMVLHNNDSIMLGNLSITVRIEATTPAVPQAAEAPKDGAQSIPTPATGIPMKPPTPPAAPAPTTNVPISATPPIAPTAPAVASSSPAPSAAAPSEPATTDKPKS